jgi:hypothetical protein
MTAAVSTGIGNFALATVATSGPAPDASLIASDFISTAPTRKPMRVRLPEDLPHCSTLSLMKAIQSLSRLRQLEPHWDGRSAETLTDDACETAVRLLVSLAIPAPPTAQIFPLTDGGVQLEWHAGGNDVEIEVDPIGEIHAFISMCDGSVVLNQELPPSLMPLIIPQIKRQLRRMSLLLGELA